MSVKQVGLVGKSNSEAMVLEDGGLPPVGKLLVKMKEFSGSVWTLYRTDKRKGEALD